LLFFWEDFFFQYLHLGWATCPAPSTARLCVGAVAVSLVTPELTDVVGSIGGGKGALAVDAVISDQSFLNLLALRTQVHHSITAPTYRDLLAKTEALISQVEDHLDRQE